MGRKRQNRSANFIVILWEIISGKAMSKSRPVTIAVVDGGILQGEILRLLSCLLFEMFEIG